MAPLMAMLAAVIVGIYGRYDLLGIEPFYGTKTGIGVGLIFTTRL